MTVNDLINELKRYNGNLRCDASVTIVKKDTLECLSGCCTEPFERETDIHTEGRGLGWGDDDDE